MYLRGAHDVVALAPVLTFGHGGIDHVDTLDEVCLTGLSYGEIEAALDAFYSNPSNVRIPILMAFKWVKLRGDKERDAEAARLRSLWLKDEKSK